MWRDEPTDERDAREPDDDSCRLGISRHCTDEGAYLWQGEPACYFCLALAEQSWERAQERNRELTADEDVWARR